MQMQELNLNEMIDVETLQTIQDRFSDATGFAAITVDVYGKPLTEYSNFTPFCQLMRESEKYGERCSQCDAHGGFEAVRIGEPQIYRCHAGLVDFAVPIKVKGQFVGTVLAGQVRIPSEEQDEVMQITNVNTPWQLESDFSNAYHELQESGYKKIEAGAQLMHSMINHFVEKDIVNYTQNELNKKNLKLIDQMKKQVELEQKMKERELKALQPQININFIYQILNTASRLAIIEDADYTRSVIFDIEEYLIYIAEHRNELISIENEIIHLKNYLQLQKLRFGERLNYELDIPEDIQGERIPALILQAIIDNAITHGLEPKKTDGLLTIACQMVDQTLVFKITDNGVGMTEQTMRLMEEEHNTLNSVAKTSGLDLYSVDMKLKSFYKSSYKFNIESKLNQGTTVTIQIPRLTGGNMNDKTVDR